MIRKSKEKKSKYKRGDKFTIEIAEVHTHYNDEGKPYSVYRVKGFNSMFFLWDILDVLKLLR